MKAKIMVIGICCLLLLSVTANDTKTEKLQMEIPTENVTELKEIVI